MADDEYNAIAAVNQLMTGEIPTKSEVAARIAKKERHSNLVAAMEERASAYILLEKANDPLYKDKRLVHGSLEGPEHGIYIRGTIEASKGCIIELPDYWQAMCEDYTVQLTPHGPYTVFIQEKHKDKVMIASSSQNYKFDYFIVGKRTDEELEVVQDA